MAIIFDIRRGNLDMQLMYKAIFELAPNRAAFVSMLFSKPQPEGLAGGNASVTQLFAAFAGVPASASLHASNLRLIEAQHTEKHGLPLDAQDLGGNSRALHDLFYQSGFRPLRPSPTYADLMTATDERGVARSFLASEASYGVLRSLEQKNLVVPGGGGISRDRRRSVPRRGISRPRAPAVGSVLSLERRAVSGRRQVGHVLPQRGDVSPRRDEHVHPVGLGRWRIWPGTGLRFEPRIHRDGRQSLLAGHILAIDQPLFGPVRPSLDDYGCPC